MIMFNSIKYIIFIIIIVLLYWQLNRKYQNILLLFASYIFYMTWDWRFLSLILISTFVDFFIGKKIHYLENCKGRKNLLLVSIITNLTILGFFKYYNFFIENLSFLLTNVGVNTTNLHLQIILPLGISFYTFQTMSYTLDIYRKKIEPTKSLLSFALYVAFFPQLVAGPIERAGHLLPQFLRKRYFTKNQFFRGIDLILWGLLKKIVIADNVAHYVNFIFNLNEPSLLLIGIGIIGFGIQILSDFSAYTDIARGSAKLLGINLMKNFNMPYISKNPIDFWKRWHISLSTWVRDYIYIPLGGSRCSNRRYLINILITWFLMGLWHGAAWHFVIWGLYHGMLIIIYKWCIQPITEKYKMFKSKLTSIISIIIMFILVHFGWLLFRIENFAQLSLIFSGQTLKNSMADISISLVIFSLLMFFSLPYFISFFIKYISKYSWNYKFNNISKRIIIYTLIIMCIIIFGSIGSIDFIYFQF